MVLTSDTRAPAAAPVSLPFTGGAPASQASFPVLAFLAIAALIVTGFISRAARDDDTIH